MTNTNHDRKSKLLTSIALGAAAAITGGLLLALPTGTAAAASKAVATKKGELLLWTHSAGNPAEMEKINQWIGEFNKSHPKSKIVFQAFPQKVYNDSVVAGALSKKLPCILDIDGPNVPNWAFSKYLAPLSIPAATTSDMLATTLGKWNGAIYAAGQFDAAVALLARKSDLAAFGLRTPTLDKPWTGAEFDAAMKKYQDSKKFDFAFDPGMAWTGEWYPYGFSPFLQSFGGDLIDRSSYKTAEGKLNGPQALAWGKWWQNLFKSGLAPLTQDGAARDSGFIDGKYGIQWNGIWAVDAASKKLGSDLLFLPAPDFGSGSKIGGGSWQWGVSASCSNKKVANEWINFLLEPSRIAAIADAQNVIPGRGAARPLSTKFKEGGELAPFYALSQKQALLRPPTPAYTNIAKVFEKAVGDIANGSDVQTALDTAIDKIDADIKANNGYGAK